MLYSCNRKYMAVFIPFIQIGLAVLLIVLVLLQQSDSGLGSAFGGGDDGGINRTRRGAEKMIFNATIVVAVLFVISAIAALLLR